MDYLAVVAAIGIAWYALGFLWYGMYCLKVAEWSTQKIGAKS